jgi:hypothetical protein
VISLSQTVIVGWTGHRPDLFVDALEARRRVEVAVDGLLSRYGSCEFVCGGQRGVDHWAAEVAIDRRIPFHLLLPQPPAAFTRGWRQEDRIRLGELVTAATSVETIDPTGELGALAYDLRSEALVRRSDVLAAVWGGVRQGGTFLTLCAARSRGLVVEEARLPVRSDALLGGRGV